MPELVDAGEDVSARSRARTGVRRWAPPTRLSSVQLRLAGALARRCPPAHADDRRRAGVRARSLNALHHEVLDAGRPRRGVSMVTRDMFSEPPPLATKVSRAGRPGRTRLWMTAGVLSPVLRRLRGVADRAAQVALRGSRGAPLRLIASLKPPPVMRTSWPSWANRRGRNRCPGRAGASAPGQCGRSPGTARSLPARVRFLGLQRPPQGGQHVVAQHGVGLYGQAADGRRDVSCGLSLASPCLRTGVALPPVPATCG